MIVETKMLGQPADIAERTIELPAGRSSLRALLAELVRVEVLGYEQRRSEQNVLRILTPADLAQGHGAGRFVAAPRRAKAAPSVAAAQERAFEAFQDGLFLVVLDGRQVDGLDDAVVVAPDSRLRLVRLVALAGG